MTPTPQSLDTVTLEAAAKVADEFAEVMPVTGDARIDGELSRFANALAAAIRALASKPAQVGDEINTAIAPLRNLAEDQHATDKQRATAVHAIELIQRLAAAPVEPATQGVDADGIEAAVAAFRESTFDALTMDECRDAAKLAVEAYLRALASPSSKDKEAASPTPAGEEIRNNLLYVSPPEAKTLRAWVDSLPPPHPMTNNPNAFVSVPREVLRALCAIEPPTSETHLYQADGYTFGWLQAVRAYRVAAANIVQSVLHAAPSAPVVSGEEELRKAWEDLRAQARAKPRVLHWIERFSGGLDFDEDILFDRIVEEFRAALKQGGNRG